MICVERNAADVPSYTRKYGICALILSYHNVPDFDTISVSVLTVLETTVIQALWCFCSAFAELRLIGQEVPQYAFHTNPNATHKSAAGVLMRTIPL